jgi:hypothetical protein
LLWRISDALPTDESATSKLFIPDKTGDWIQDFWTPDWSTVHFLAGIRVSVVLDRYVYFFWAFIRI